MFESELALAVLIGAWILYELYGRVFTEWFRIAGGIAVIGYLYWQLHKKPDEFKDSLDLVKQMMVTSTSSSSSSSKEKRNVTGLMKKKVAASQSWKCGACMNTLDETYEVDHKLALYKGGSNEAENLVALCPHCHRKKTVDERLN